MKEVRPCNVWQFSADGENWREVTLPHTPFIEPAEVYNPQFGTVFYRLTVSAPEEWRNRIVYLEIGAAMQKAKVSVNGQYQFTHFGGYQKFCIPLFDALEYGKDNLVEIELDNAETFDMPPGKNKRDLDFLYYSGLHRDARLLVYEPVHFTEELAVSVTAGGGVFIRTLSADEKTAKLSASCHVLHENTALGRFRSPDPAEKDLVEAETVIRDPAGNTVFSGRSEPVRLRCNEDHTFTFEPEIASPRLWSPDTPELYTAEFTLYWNGRAVDSRTETFGIRTFEFKREGFFLNGKKTFLLGTNRHSEFPFVGNAAPANAQYRDAVLIKKYGFNFVRLSHYNQSPAFLDACDRLGLCVMPAIPGWQAWHANSSFIGNALRDVRELIRSLRNHPCVMLWEVSLNEAYPPVWINREFCKAAHEEYPGCYTAGDTFGLAECWDVMFPCDHLSAQDRPLLLREYGDWSFGGNESTSRRPCGAPVGEALVQAWNFIWTYNRAHAVPGMIGCADWCFFDYNRGCGHKSGTEESGSLNLFRRPKIKAQFYRSQSGEPMVYAVHDSQNSKLIVFSNCDEVELARGGKTVRRQTPDAGPDTPYGAAGSPSFETAVSGGFDKTGGYSFDGGNASHTDHPPFTFFGIPAPEDGEALELTGFKNGTPAASFTLRKPGKAVELKTVVRTEGIEPEAGDMIFVDAVLVDENGTVVPETVPVALEISGGAEIIGGMTETEAGIASWFVRITGKNYGFSAKRTN